MPRAIWSGAISFGLVNVPVKVYTAVSQKEVRFNQLHAEDGGRLQYRRVCSIDGEEVPYDQIVKGFEIAPDEFVMITPEELEALEPEATRLIDIEDFVELTEIDPIYYDKSFYLAPGKGGAKAYRVLLDAMRASGKVAIGRVVLRTRQYLVALRPLEDALVMTTLNYADEVVPTSALDDLPGAEFEAGKKELAMARQLIEALSEPFDPDKYHDEHRQRVLDMIEAKAEGHEVVVQPPTEEPNLVVDLMSALEASLQKAAGSGSRNGGNGASPTKGRRRSGAAPSAAGDEEAVPLRAAAASRKTSASTKVAPKKRAAKQ